MKKKFLQSGSLMLVAFMWLACNNNTATESAATESPATATKAGQSAVQDDQSQKDVVKIAVGSPDHTTLVKALQQAEYVDALSNAGPFTVFAPTNAAFDKLPAGTLDGLMQPAKKDDLRSILEYHVFVGVLKPEMLEDGKHFNQASLQDIIISKKDGKIMINGSINVIGEPIPAANGIVYIVDGVLLPPPAK